MGRRLGISGRCISNGEKDMVTALLLSGGTGTRMEIDIAMILTASVSLYWLISQDTREEKPSFT